MIHKCSLCLAPLHTNHISHIYTYESGNVRTNYFCNENHLHLYFKMIRSLNHMPYSHDGYGNERYSIAIGYASGIHTPPKPPKTMGDVFACKTAEEFQAMLNELIEEKMNGSLSD